MPSPGLAPTPRALHEKREGTDPAGQACRTVRGKRRAPRESPENEGRQGRAGRPRRTQDGGGRGGGPAARRHAGKVGGRRAGSRESSRCAAAAPCQLRAGNGGAERPLTGRAPGSGRPPSARPPRDVPRPAAGAAGVHQVRRRRERPAPPPQAALGRRCRPAGASGEVGPGRARPEELPAVTWLGRSARLRRLRGIRFTR